MQGFRPFAVRFPFHLRRCEHLGCDLDSFEPRMLSRGDGQPMSWRVFANFTEILSLSRICTLSRTVLVVCTRRIATFDRSFASSCKFYAILESSSSSAEASIK